MDTEISHEKILCFAVRVGEIMLKSGAETYRVEDTIVRILNTQGYTRVDPFVTPTGIIVSIQRDDMPIQSIVARIKNRSTRFDKIEKINQLSRDYVMKVISFEEAVKRLNEIDRTPPYSDRLTILLTGLASGFFSLMFQGDVFDFFISLAIGTTMAFLQYLLKKKEIIHYFRLFLLSFFVGSMGALVTTLWPLTVHTEAIIIGCVMPLVPGVAFTNAVRDTIGDELLSGISRGIEAFFIAVVIAAGVGIPMGISLFLGGTV